MWFEYSIQDSKRGGWEGSCAARINSAFSGFFSRISAYFCTIADRDDRVPAKMVLSLTKKYLLFK